MGKPIIEIVESLFKARSHRSSWPGWITIGHNQEANKMPKQQRPGPRPNAENPVKSIFDCGPVVKNLPREKLKKPCKTYIINGKEITRRPSV